MSGRAIVGKVDANNYVADLGTKVLPPGEEETKKSALLPSKKFTLYRWPDKESSVISDLTTRRIDVLD